MTFEHNQEIAVSQLKSLQMESPFPQLTAACNSVVPLPIAEYPTAFPQSQMKNLIWIFNMNLHILALARMKCSHAHL